MRFSVAGRLRERASLAAGVILAGVLLAGLAGVALGVINLRFTPSDLVRGSADVYLLTVTPPKETSLEAAVVETLKGKALAEKQIVLGFAEAKELTKEEVADALSGAKSASAVLLVSAAQEGDEAGARSGSLLIGTRWFAITLQDGKWSMDRDDKVLSAVWAGSARMLVEATRYVEADPTAFFPVRSDLSWGADQNLGQAPGANGCLLANFGPPLGACMVILSSNGDRVYQLATGDAKPADLTAKTALKTSSKRAALGDFDGDGRLDLASWDGKALRVAAQKTDGTFAPLAGTTELAGCLSLDAMDAGGAGLLAGTADGPVVLTPSGPGAFKAAPVLDAAQKALLAELGPGGACVVADHNNDGRCDILQLFSKGNLLYAGEAPGKFQAPAKLPGGRITNPRTAICGDFDTDGSLDVIAGGDDGLALLSHGENRRLECATFVTGELAYHGSQNSPMVHTVSPADVNSDGRQGAALLYVKQKPMFFFNRGFACFGWARELDVAGATDMPPEAGAPPPEKPAEKLKAAEAVQAGALAGMIWDLNGDGAQDLLNVTPDGEVWALYGRADGRKPLGLTITLSAKSKDPLTVTVSDQRRRVAMHVLRPGVPVFTGRVNPGPFTVEWRGPDGKARTKKAVVTGLAQLELDPQAAP